MQKNKCILVYGLSDDEINKLEKINFKVLNITNDMANMKLKDILKKVDNRDENIELPNEKVILFNGYGNNEMRTTIKSVRNVINGGMLAVVTPISINWTFKYLLEHLVEEREFANGNKRER